MFRELSLLSFSKIIGIIRKIYGFKAILISHHILGPFEHIL
jgi:hypothetical protein